MASKLLMIPKTKFNPRFHANTKELELLNSVISFTQNQDAKQFRMHEAPLSVHGQLHIGHFYNKTFKDIIKRYKLLRGYQIMPSMIFECFGPQIEHAAFSSLFQQGTKTLEYDENTIRQTCSKYVEQQLINYTKSIKRWGLLNQDLQVTIDPQYQMKVLKQFAKLLEMNKIIQSHKVIIWSPSRLAEIPLEQVIIQEKDTPAHLVKFKLHKTSTQLDLYKLEIFFILPIANTFKILGMQAFQVVQSEEYLVFKDKDILIIPKSIYHSHKNQFQHYQYQGSLNGQEMQHFEFTTQFSNYSIPIIVGDNLNIICPAHQLEDIPFSKVYNLSRKSQINEQGQIEIKNEYYDILNGEANKKILSLLREQNLILDSLSSVKEMEYHHKVTGEQLILRSVKGFFVKFDEIDFEMYQDRQPPINNNGSYSSYTELMETLYGEWCITNHNVWGIPIPLFKAKNQKSFKKLFNGYLLNQEIVEYFAELVGKHGSDIYWQWNIVDLIPESYRGKADELEKETLVFDRLFSFAKESDLILEGEDQHEAFLFGSQMMNMLLQEGKFDQLITHGIIEHQGEKLSKDSGINIDDTIEGAVKLNGERQYGSGVDILRALVTNIIEKVNQDRINFKQQQINFIRKTYWKILGCLEGYQVQYAFEIDQFKFNDRYMYDQLVLFVFNITKAYEQYDIQTAFNLYIDFMQNYVEPYIDCVRSKLIAFHSEYQISLIIFYKLLDYTLKVISPILIFNAKDIYKIDQAWPKIPTSHLQQAQNKMVQLNLFHRIRIRIHEQIDANQERIKQKNLNKRLQIVFILQPNTYELNLIDQGQNQLHLFLNCGQVTIESEFQNKKRPNHLTFASFVINEQFLNQKIKIPCKFYEIQENSCPRCLEHKPIINQVCNDCTSYIQIEEQKLKQIH